MSYTRNGDTVFSTSSSKPNFIDLAPVGFETVAALADAYSAAIDAMSYLASSPLFGLANQDKALDDGAPSTIYQQLMDVYQKLYAIGSMPVEPLRSVITYSEAFKLIVPADTGISPEDIATALKTLVEMWQIPDSEAFLYQGGQIRRLLAEISVPLNTVLANFRIIESDMRNAKVDIYPPAKEDSVFDVLASGLDPLVVIKASADSRFRLNTILHQALTDKQFAMTYSAIKKSNKVLAQELLDSVVDFNSSVKVLITTLTTVDSKTSCLASFYSSFCTAMSNVDVGIQRFSLSLSDAENPKKNSNRDDVVSAWIIVGTNSTTYLRILGGGKGVPISKSKSLSFASDYGRLMVIPKRLSGPPPYQKKLDAEVAVTPDSVRAAFGAPLNAVTTLPEMTAQSGKISSAFDSLLTLPFAETLMVTSSQGNEVSVRTMMIDMRARYQVVQGSTVPIARDLYTLSNAQQDLLPLVNQPDGLPLNEFLVASLTLVLQYGKSAGRIAEETAALRDEFKAFLDVLGSNLKEMQTQIDALELQIKNTENQHTAATVNAIMEAVLFVVFTAGAIGVVIFGAPVLGPAVAPIAAALGIQAGRSLINMIEQAVAAGKLLEVIHRLKDLLATCMETRNQLAQIIPQFSGIVDLMSSLANIWTDIKGSLDEVKSTEQLWQNPAYFTADMTQLAIASWHDVSKGCLAYADIVGGITPAINAGLNMNEVLSNPKLLKAIKSIAAAEYEDPPPVYSVYKTYPVAIRAVLDSNISDQILSFLSAPDVIPNGLKKSYLTEVAGTYRNIGEAIRSIGYRDLGDSCIKLGSDLNREIIPKMSEAIHLLLQFSSSQPDLPPIPVQAYEWNIFCTSKLASLGPGNQQAVICDTLLRDFQNNSKLVLNTCLSKRLELESQRSAKQKSLDDAQNQYNSYRWLIYIPSPIAIIIEQLIESIRKDQEDIRNLQQQLKLINDVIGKVISATDTITYMFDYTRMLSVFWAALTTKTNTAAGLWKVLELFPEKEMELAKSTWKVLEDGLVGW